ncbi:MAG TPA: BatA domain-containing protein, partial [Candidatus Cloacimonadota bacterium]|nr:BatA domain-containing protein [Candidatus Cloacimonadota bacterium]
FFAAATVLPLIIWLLARRKPPKVLFPTLRFIKQSQEQEKNRTKITNIILLIIRMLIILLIALAVARPMLASQRLGKSRKHPPTAVAIILDTSYSMDYLEGGKTLLDKAKDYISQINARAQDADRLILITRDRDWNELHSLIYVKEIPQDILEGIVYSYEPLPWDEVLLTAERKLSEAQMPNREIYVLSDFINETIHLQSSSPILTIPLSPDEPRSNLSLSQARILPRLVSRNKLQTAQFVISNHGVTDRTDVLIKAVINDIKVAEKFVSVPARSSLTETISFDIAREGWQGGYLEVLDEYLTADNRSYFALEYYQYPKVGVITNTRLPLYLSTILNVYTGGRGAVTISPEALNLSLLEDYNLFIFYDFGSMNPKLREIFTSLKTRQIGSLVCLGNTLPADTKALLEQSFGITIGSYSKQARSIDYISAQHNVSALIADKRLKYPVIGSYWDNKGSTAPLISAQNTALALMQDNQALWLWDSGSTDNTFFIDPAFPVFAYRQFTALQSSNLPNLELSPGDAIRASALALPDGNTINLARGLYFAKDPGIYTINPGNPRQAMAAVNIDYKDSDNAYAKPSGKYRQLGKNWQEEIFLSRLGRDLWKILLAAALLLMILEIIIVKLQESRGNL